LPDTYYVGKLVAPDTVNTMPEETLLAVADHGKLDDILEPDSSSAENVIAEIAAQGIDVDALAGALRRQGAKAFEADWAALLGAIETKTARLARGSARSSMIQGRQHGQ
jgi:transaldolase